MSRAMNLTILYFASIKEALDCEREFIEDDQFATVFATVNDLVHQLSQRGPIWQSTLLDNKVLIAVNQTIGTLDTKLQAGDEIAFFPPVTGG